MLNDTLDATKHFLEVFTRTLIYKAVETQALSMLILSPSLWQCVSWTSSLGTEKTTSSQSTSHITVLTLEVFWIMVQCSNRAWFGCQWYQSLGCPRAELGQSADPDTRSSQVTGYRKKITKNIVHELVYWTWPNKALKIIQSVHLLEGRTVWIPLLWDSDGATDRTLPET